MQTYVLVLVWTSTVMARNLAGSYYGDSPHIYALQRHVRPLVLMPVQEVKGSQQQPNNNMVEEQGCDRRKVTPNVPLIAIPPNPGRLSSLLQDVQLVNEYS